MNTTTDTPRTSGIEPSDVAGTNGVPDAIEAASVGQHRRDLAFDPAAVRARGVEWVRPRDLMMRAGSRVAGAGIDFHTELMRRTRTATADSARYLRDRARHLPPVSAFGRSGTRTGAERGPVGMA
ncbi:hypothetical protein GCM10010910_09580 [Microbacterium nanhaiense]|uniref:Uncharacterized protein n=1 Tax=Microbacterium nanhaiense TaxID=1301026 RepID=A0ABQ2MZN3_9MICO|nr:hypothetical protein [Microbacterium nanhaiense]GGO61538.1 hypothetical protein GCM10010910_09580 [Microbacterium nanhaiense]